MGDRTGNGLHRIPTIEECRRIFRALAMLDAILSPEWAYRYYSYNGAWAEHEEMASMRDGQGSHYFALFSPAGLMIKGYDRERAKTGESEVGVGEVPGPIAEFLREPAFMGEDTTFCLWNAGDGTGWKADKPYDESDYELLRMLSGGPDSYCAWALDYYEVDADRQAVRRIFDLEPLTRELLRMLNEEISLDELEEDLEEIGYPRFSGPR